MHKLCEYCQERMIEDKFIYEIDGIYWCCKDCLGKCLVEQFEENERNKEGNEVNVKRYENY